MCVRSFLRLASPFFTRADLIRVLVSRRGWRSGQEEWIKVREGGSRERNEIRRVEMKERRQGRVGSPKRYIVK